MGVRRLKRLKGRLGAHDLAYTVPRAVKCVWKIESIEFGGIVKRNRFGSVYRVCIKIHIKCWHLALLGFKDFVGLRYSFYVCIETGRRHCDQTRIHRQL